MRTTIDLSPDAYHVAKALAASRRVSLGKAISDLVLGAGVSTQVKDEGSRWPSITLGRPLTQEQVKELLDDE